MFSSKALRHELAVKGNQLLRAMVRSFYPPEDSIVIGALTKLSPDHRQVKQDELAAYLNVTGDYISSRLGHFVQDKILSKDEMHQKLPYTQIYVGGSLIDKEQALRLVVDILINQGITKFDGEELSQAKLLEKSLDWLVQKLPNTQTLKFNAQDRHPASTQYTYRENDEIVLVAKISDGRKREHIVKYAINYENLVYVVKYRLLSIQLMYDRRSDVNFYYCPNSKCHHYAHFVRANDLYLTAANLSGGGGGLGGGGGGAMYQAFNQSRQKMNPTLSHNSNSNSNSNNLVQLGSVGMGGTGHSSAMQNLNQSQHLNTMGPNSMGIKRAGPVPLPSSAYPCPRCETVLIQCGGPEIQDLKRQFLAKTGVLNQLTFDVYDILKQTRQYEVKRAHTELMLRSDLNPDGTPAGPKTGVGARGGCSTAADLASRVEKLKTPLPWDELSLADHERLLFEQNKQKEIEEQIARQMKLQEEQEERERQHQSYLAEQQKRKRQNALKRSIFGIHDGTDDPEGDAALLSKFGGDLEALARHKQAQLDLKKVDALAQYQKQGVMGLTLDEIERQHLAQQQQMVKGEGGAGGQEEEYDPSSFWVTLGGGKIKMRLEDVDETHLDMMTEEEFQRYSDLADGVGENDEGGGMMAH